MDVYRVLERGPRGVPFKRDLTPERFAACLGHVFIMEASDGGYSFRLFGTSIVDILRADHTGKRLDDVLSGQDLDEVTRILDRCRETPAILVSNERLVAPDHDFMVVQIIRAPFLDNDGKVRFVSGTLEQTGGTVPPGSEKVLSELELEWDWATHRMFTLPVAK